MIYCKKEPRRSELLQKMQQLNYAKRDVGVCSDAQASAMSIAGCNYPDMPANPIRHNEPIARFSDRQDRGLGVAMLQVR